MAKRRLRSGLIHSPHHWDRCWPPRLELTRPSPLGKEVNMRLAWCSDTHLDMVDSFSLEQFSESIANSASSAIVLTGDISDGKNIGRHLADFAALDMPVYFVLGNHDYYHRSIADVRSEIAQITNETAELVWLSSADPVALADGVALIGHDGWADGTAGTGLLASPVQLNDERLIQEHYQCADRAELAQLVRKLAREGTQFLQGQLDGLGADIHHVIVATHVPPFTEAALYEGNPSEPDFLPHFSNPGLGRMLVEHVEKRPNRKLSVLCGHTHDVAFKQPNPRIKVHVAGAQYGAPRIAGFVEADDTGSPTLTPAHTQLPRS